MRVRALKTHRGELWVVKHTPSTRYQKGEKSASVLEAMDNLRAEEETAPLYAQAIFFRSRFFAFYVNTQKFDPL